MHRKSVPAVRPARVEEAAAMRELQQIAFAEEGRRSGTRDIPPLQEDVNSIVQHVQEQIALVAVEHERLVGSVRGVKGDGGYVIRALIVHPAHQGKGIGSTLVRALEAALPKPTRVDLTTNTLMTGNVPFYEKHGYKVDRRTEPMPGIVLAHMSKHFEIDR
jgi:ribosomal protein S18 acetylase RimI-like enzyme